MPPVPCSPEAVPRRTLGIRIRLVKGDLLIGEEDKAHLLSGPAQLIFASLNGECTVSDVSRLIAEEYGIDEQEALEDVREFLGDLTGRGWVEW
ncbi:PqqD family protein [Micromonospora sp. C51]|uniref:PqqD family protein n=1 Tax=Micromonospora sp. C51 TaxID=2824879 RepID=UPI001FFCBA5A|nr:PqqD family protein [Micromonospora sp. C51]